jgi:hypothetical protein
MSGGGENQETGHLSFDPAQVGRVQALLISRHTVKKGDACLACSDLTTPKFVKAFAVSRTEMKVNPPPSIPHVAKPSSQT